MGHRCRRHAKRGDGHVLCGKHGSGIQAAGRVAGIQSDPAPRRSRKAYIRARWIDCRSSMARDRAQTIERLRTRLLSDAGNAGWGYYEGKASRIEPTCWALLALSGTWDGTLGEWPAFAQR